MAPPKKLFEDMYSDQTLVLYVTRKSVTKQSNPWISHTHDKKHIMCKTVQEEKKIMLYHLTNIWALIAFSKCGLQWCSSFYFMLKITMHGSVHFIRGVRKKKFEHCRQRKECLYKDSQHCTNLSTYQQWETGEEVKIKNKNQEQL